MQSTIARKNSSESCGKQRNPFGAAINEEENSFNILSIFNEDAKENFYESQRREMNDVKKVAQVICEHEGIDPFSLEPGDGSVVDGVCQNGEPGHYMWRKFTVLARRILQVLKLSTGGNDEPSTILTHR